MHNIRRKEFTNATLDELIRYVDDRAYKIFIPPQVCTTHTAVPATFGATNSAQHWIMADAVTSGVVCTIRKPDTWLSGTIRTILFYSGSAAGNAFRINARIQIARVGDLLTAPTYATNFNANIGGPTAINTIMEVDNQQGAPIGQADDLIMLALNRIGADANDTNAGDMYFLGRLLVYTEGAREIGLKTVG